MNRPYTFINVAMTADGKIDTFERKGSAISSKRDKSRVDELRAAADGILVGGRTLLDETPKLTVKSEAVLRQTIKSVNGKIPVVSAGGIMNPEDAKRRLEMGAALVQVYTGLVYRGPGLVKEIVRAL